MAAHPQPDTFRVTLLVVQALENLRIPYLIGGSLACAIYGLARSTMDADIVADIKAEHVQPFIQALQMDFYIGRNDSSGDYSLQQLQPDSPKVAF